MPDPCEQFVGRKKDICRGYDDDGIPVVLKPPHTREAYLRRWGLLTEDNAESTAKVHEAKFVQTRINERASTKSPKQAKPSLIKRAVSATKAAVAHAKDRFREASPEEQESRLVICRDCDKYEPADASCKLCGCCLTLKKRLRTSSCPIGKWGVADIAKPTPEQTG